MNAHAGLITGRAIGTAIGTAWTDADAARLRLLWAERVTKADIAEKMGRTEQSIATYVKRHRADFPPRPHGRIAKAKVAAPPKVCKPRAPGLTDIRPDAERPKNPVRLISLSDGTCRWPVEGSGQSAWFCGAEPLAKSSYCACHAARSVQTKPREELTWHSR